MADITDKQVRFALDLLKQEGLSALEPVTGGMSRRYGIPIADSVIQAVKSLTKEEASALIDKMVQSR